MERELARLANAQHGVVTRAQLLDAGVTPAEIGLRLRKGALWREYRGVYRVGHRAPSVEARYLAAVLACGEGAVLSGRAAASPLGMLKGRPPRARGDDAEPSGASRGSRPGARVDPTSRRHDVARDSGHHRRRARSSTSPPSLAIDDLARACHEAGVRHGTTPADVEAVLARRPHSRGRGEAAQDPARRRARHAQRARAAVPRAAARGRARRCRRPTVPRAVGASTAAGPSSASRSSSTATATTTRATPGSRTAAASARPTPAATSSAGTRTATCSRIRG